MTDELESFKRTVRKYDNRDLLCLYGTLWYEFTERGSEIDFLKLDYVEELLLKRMGEFKNDSK